MMNNHEICDARHYRIKAIAQLLAYIAQHDNDYHNFDFLLDECLRSIFGLDDKSAGKPPYEDWLSEY